MDLRRGGGRGGGGGELKGPGGGNPGPCSHFYCLCLSP